MSFRERLEPVLTTGDHVAAWELLDSLEGEELREAKEWFAGSKRWLGNLHQLTFCGRDRDEQFATLHEAHWVVGACALVLCGPATAARRVPWSHLWDYRDESGEAHLVHRLWEADADWVRSFTDEAAALHLGAQDLRNSGLTLGRVVRSAVVHHGLPCPSGETFAAVWLAGTPPQEGVNPRTRRGPSVQEWLAQDPLMPDLLLLRLASDAVGSDDWLPAALPELVDRGAVSRDALLTTVFESLTRPRRPSAQAVLAACVTSLEVTAAEVPGGLAYLLGVLATSKGSVGNVLLPYAAELIATPDDLLELTRLVAGRPEKRHRGFVLGILKDPATHDRFGSEPVVRALQVLAHDDDTAFADQVRRVLERLPGAAMDEAAQADPGVPMGLWDLTPPDPETVTRDPFWGAAPGWGVVERTYRAPHPTQLDWLVARGLDAIHTDAEAWHADIRRKLGWLLERGRPSVPRVNRILEDWFLGGGLRAAYPVALWFAGECAAMPRLPSGLAHLLRLLARYAVEVPADARPAVPGPLRELADRGGRTSAQVEARQLVEALAPPAAEPAAEPAAPTADDVPAARGLWRDLEPAYPPDGELRVDDPFAAAGDDPKALGEAISRWIGTPDSAYFSGPRLSHGPSTENIKRHTEPYRSDQALAAVVRAVSRCGEGSVRGALPTPPYPHLDPVLYAIDLWRQGRLDRTTLWRLGDPLISSFRLRLHWDAMADLTAREIGVLLRAVPSLADQLDPTWSPGQVTEIPDLGPLLAPGRWGFPADPARPVLVAESHLSSPGAQLTLSRAAEALLNADRNATLLSTPTRADLTMTFDELLERLRQIADAGAEVGPLDLVQALHRLQPTPPGRAGELDQIGSVVTSASFEAPDAGTSRDAVDLVRTWVTAGGLPPLQADVVDGRWTTSTRTPVSFATCRATPYALRREGWWLGWLEMSTRVIPGWPDRTWEQAYLDGGLWNGGTSRLQSRTSGEWALAMHDRWWQALSATRMNTYDDGDMAALRGSLAPSRIVPEHLAAAAVGRHRARVLSLGKALVPLGALCEEGFVSALWRPLLATADGLAGEAPRPTDLAALLRLLHTLAVEVPDPEPAPKGLRALADAKGSTKAHVEVRTLVATLDALSARTERG